SRAAVSRETGTAARALVRSALSSANVGALSGLRIGWSFGASSLPGLARQSIRLRDSAFRWPRGSRPRANGWRREEVGLSHRALAAPDMRRQQGQRGRRHAVDAARLADGPRPNRLQLLADFHGEAGQRRVVEVLAQLKTFVPAIGRHVGGLALKIDRVLGIDFELRSGDPVKAAEVGPDPCNVVQADGRIGQKLEGGPPLAVA